MDITMGLSATTLGILTGIAILIGWKFIPLGLDGKALKIVKVLGVVGILVTATAMGLFATSAPGELDPTTGAATWGWTHTCGDTALFSVSNNTTISGDRSYLVNFDANFGAVGTLDEGTINIDYAAFRTDTSIEGSVAKCYLVSAGTVVNTTTSFDYHGIAYLAGTTDFNVVWDDGTTTFGDEMSFPADPDQRSDTLGCQIEINPNAVVALGVYDSYQIVLSVAGIQDTITIMRIA